MYFKFQNEEYEEIISSVEGITHPPAKAVPLFLEGSPCNSPLIKGEQKGDVMWKATEQSPDLGKPRGITIIMIVHHKK